MPPLAELLIDVTLLMLLLVTAIGVVRSTNLLVSTILLSLFSLIMAGQYLILGAPDVAITEAAVGAGISTILFLLALFNINEKEIPLQRSHAIPVIVTLVVGALLTNLVFHMPLFGDPNAPAQAYLAPYYINQSQHDIDIPNIVTSILASYRGYDTFGETVVIFTAGLAVFALLKKDQA